MSTELEKFIGKVVIRDSIKYLVTDLFKIHSLSTNASYGLALVDIKSKTTIAGFVTNRVTNFKDKSLMGFSLDIGPILDLGVYLLDPLNNNVNKDLVDVNRMPEITRPIKKYAGQLMRDYYINKNMYFNKIPQYRKVMRNSLKYYLYPEKCIIKNYVR